MLRMRLFPLLAIVGSLACAVALMVAVRGQAAPVAPLERSSAEGRAAAAELLWNGVRPRRPSRVEGGPATVGTRFTVSTAGTVTAVKVWRPRRARGPQTVSLWTSDGRRLASGQSAAATAATGWRTVSLANSLRVEPGNTFVVAYRARRSGAMAVSRKRLPDTSGTHLAFTSRAGMIVRGSRMGFPSSRHRRVFVVTPVFRPDPDVTPQPDAPLRGWQVSASRVGLAPLGLACDELPVYTGPDHPPAGTTIARKRIVSPLVLDSGTVIEESCVKPTSSWLGLPLVSTVDRELANPVTIRDTEIDGSLLDARHSAFTGGFSGIADLYRNYIHDVGSGISFVGTGSQHSAVVENNYVDNLSAYGDGATDGNHSDAFTVRDFDASAVPSRTLTVRDNRFDCDSGNDTGAVFIQTYNGDISNVSLTGNLLEGDGYQLGLESGFGHTYSGMVATDNRFSGTGWGPAYIGGTGPNWSTWSGNYLANPARADYVGRPVHRP